MYCPWLIAFGLEVAWLGALWLVIPESRPWSDEDMPEQTSAAGWRSWVRTGLLYAYTFYHLPAILFAGLVFLLSGGLLQGKPFPFHRVRPEGFLVLALINGLCYVWAGVW